MGSNPAVRFGLRFLAAIFTAIVMAVVIFAIATLPGVVSGASGVGLAFGALLLGQAAFGRVRRVRPLPRKREY